MKNDVLKLFAEFLEKQDVLSKLTENERLHAYGYSEVHVIATIGDMKNANVTAIAQTLKITKGAVSKITKKLLLSNVIESYTHLDNKQKIFFKLTDNGRFVYEEHAKRHALWQQRDNKFLTQFSPQQLQLIEAFMTSYNLYLEENINELGGKKNAH